MPLSTPTRRCGRLGYVERTSSGSIEPCGRRESPGLPIVLARIDDADDVDMIRQLLRAHEYWRMKQLSADVVIINEKATSYMQDLQGSLESLVRGSQLRLSPDTRDASGKIFLLRGDLICPSDTRAATNRSTRGASEPSRHTFRTDFAIAPREREHLRRCAPRRAGRYRKRQRPQPEALQFFNGLGGFDENGREYVTCTGEGLRTPEPWVNVIANPIFRFPGLGVGLGIHVVAEQPRESTHSVVQRPLSILRAKQSTCATKALAKYGAHGPAYPG